MFLFMPFWHVHGDQNYSGQAYRISSQRFTEKVHDSLPACTGTHLKVMRNVQVLVDETVHPASRHCHGRSANEDPA